jgi:hypothetical protein
MEELKFYDLKSKKKFSSSKYKLVTKKGRNYAICQAPSGIESWRIVGKAKLVGKAKPIVKAKTTKKK